MKLSIRNILCFAVILLCICGCKKSETPSTADEFKDNPESRAAAEQFLDAITEMDFEKASELFGTDASEKPLPCRNISDAKEQFTVNLIENNPEFENHKNKAKKIADAFFSAILKVCKYEIIRIENSGNEYIYTALVTLPEDSDFMNQYLKESMSKHTADSSIYTIYTELIKKGKVYTDSDSEQFINALTEEICNRVINDLSTVSIPTEATEYRIPVVFENNSYTLRKE